MLIPHEQNVASLAMFWSVVRKLCQLLDAGVGPRRKPETLRGGHLLIRLCMPYCLELYSTRQTPWPSWAIVATPQTPKESVQRFLERLNAEVQDFNSAESRENGKDIEFIKKTLDYQEQDIKDCQLSSAASGLHPVSARSCAPWSV